MLIKNYTISYSNKQARWTCTCPDYKFRKAQARPEGDIETYTCKHIREAIQNLPTPEDTRYKPRIQFEEVADLLREMGKEFRQFEIAGSYRRQRPLLKDLDVVVYLENQQDFAKLKELIELVGVIEYGKLQRITAIINQVQVDFRIVYCAASWYTSLLHFTGSKDENIRLRRKALQLGMKLNEYELKASDRLLPILSERDVYGYLGEPYREPWER